MKEIKQTKTRVQKILNKYKAFTLVELIIVITILAILATIAFVSFQSFTKDARDADRTTTLANIEKALELHYTKTNKYPNPDANSDGETGSGYVIVEGDIIQLTQVGVIGDNISRMLNISKTPIDPLSNTHYTYGISTDQKNYQLAGTIEGDIAYNSNPIIQTTHANVGKRARVVGNYKFPLKTNIKVSGITTPYVFNIPSLIATGELGHLYGTGINLLDDTHTRFIMDKGYNIPYSLDNNIPQNKETPKQHLEAITGTGGLSLTGVTVPSKQDWTSDEGKTIAQAIYGTTDQDKVDQIGTTLYGATTYYAEVKDNNASSTTGGSETGGESTSTVIDKQSPTAEVTFEDYSTNTTDYGTGYYIQNTTGLKWAANDSGNELKWATNNNYTEPTWNGSSYDYPTSEGQTGNSSTDYPAFAYCEGLGTGGWRLPTKRELFSIMTDVKLSGMSYYTALPSVSTLYYWSSTDSAATTYNAWYGSFNDAYTSYNSKTVTHRVLCIHD